jgi:hypothetical protein
MRATKSILTFAVATAVIGGGVLFAKLWTLPSGETSSTNEHSTSTIIDQPKSGKPGRSIGTSVAADANKQADRQKTGAVQSSVQPNPRADTQPLPYNPAKAAKWYEAKSAEEAEWMKRKGFPSPTEHLAYKQMSDAELKALAERGSLHAKAHYFSRQVTDAYVTGKNSDIALPDKNPLMNEIYLSDDLYSKHLVVELTADIEASAGKAGPGMESVHLRTYLRHYFLDTVLIGASLGDQHLVLRADDEVYARWREMGAREWWEMNASRLGAPARWERKRQQQGLPPTVIDPRPVRLWTYR